jgi:hypothetical protein
MSNRDLSDSVWLKFGLSHYLTIFQNGTAKSDWPQDTVSAVLPEKSKTHSNKSASGKNKFPMVYTVS